MKKVFSDMSKVAHLWANQHQDEARNPGNTFYFDGRTIYSYGGHFPIATIMEDGIVLFTLRTYSKTTAGHVSYAYSACKWRKIIYCYRTSSSSCKENWGHSENLDYWRKEIEENLSKLARARKPEKYLLQIEHIQSQVKEYCDYFEIEPSEELKEIIKDTTSEGYHNFIMDRAERLKELAKKQKLGRKKAYIGSVKKWFAGEIHRVSYIEGYDFLKMDKDTGRIRTTQDVVIPYEIAVEFHKLVKTGELKVDDTILNFKVMKVGKIIQIGCHTFRKTYLVKFGNNLKKPKIKKIC